MAQLKNGTANTGSSGYGFPSGSFTHPKQPNMPSDQRAKLLAMHRDGKATAGIYVAVVLIVYFILVIMLLCRYGKRRRAPEPSSGLDSATEQGRLQRISFQISKIASCGGGGDGCCAGNLSRLCFGRCQLMETSSGKSTVHSTQNGTDGDKNMTEENNMQLQRKDETDAGKDSGVGKCHNRNNDLKKKIPEGSRDRENDNQNEDSEESLEDD